MKKAVHAPSAIAALAIVLSALSGCQPVLHDKGNILKPAAVNLIQPGVTTRDQVKALLGSPTVTNAFRKDRWIYIQDRRFEGYRTLNRLEITFDDRWVVKEVKRNFKDELLDPTDLAGYDQRATFTERLFAGKPAASDAVPALDASRKEETPWWKLWKSEKAALKTPDRKHSESLDPLEGKNIQGDGLLDRLMDLRMPEWSKKSEPAPTLVPDQEGWWKGMFSADPAKKPIPQPPPKADPKVKKVKDEDVMTRKSPPPEVLPPSMAPPPSAAPAPAAKPTEAPAQGEKPWYKFWN
ncbi:MAG: outer membrane protein assembly factor BamE [Magnetococcales bacterium]|nr:outer membrane protein assembly factor BamE [Magnetococcales bacterium]